MTNRLFFAYNLPLSAIDFIVNLRDEIYGIPNNVNWESSDKLHITSKFLGDVGDYLTELIIDRFENFNAESIKCEFGEFNIFKKNNEPKILFAGIRSSALLTNIQIKIENEFGLLGFDREIRNFKPHITILRIKGMEDFNILDKFVNKKIDHSFKINTVSLIKSELKPSGSEYTILKSFKLN